MEPQTLKTTLLQHQPQSQSVNQQQSHHYQQQNKQHLQQQQQKKVKKRMTSIKHPPPSKYKHTITKIFNNYYPIKLNQSLDSKCEAQLGYLFIGGSGLISNQQILTRNQILAILTVLDYKRYDKQDIGQKIQNINEIQQHQFIDVQQDSIDILPYLQHSYDFINQMLSNGLNILVHSNQGLSRAPIIVINYLMKKFKLKYQQAYSIVLKRKPQINIKSNLTQQIQSIIY